MIGYKLAVGVCKDEGFFPVMVELEIPEDAEVIEPITQVSLFCNKIPEGFNLSNAFNFSFSLSDEYTTISFSKYRTNKCKVLNVYAFDGKEHLNWNKIGYSLYEIIQYVRCKVGNITEYEKTEVSSYLNLDTQISCGEGIHFFETEYIAKAYYDYEEFQWFADCVAQLNEELINLSFYYKASKDYTAHSYSYSYPLPKDDVVEVLYKRYTGATDISCFSEKR